MVIEQSTRSIYFLTDGGSSNPWGSFVDGCLFYGGPMGFDSAKFTITQQSGAWNEVLRHHSADRSPFRVDPWEDVRGDLDLEWNFRTRNKESNNRTSPALRLHPGRQSHMNSEGSVFHVQTTSTSFETRVESSPDVFSHCCFELTGIYHDWDRRVSAMWSVGQRFLISTSKSSGRRALMWRRHRTYPALNQPHPCQKTKPKAGCRFRGRAGSAFGHRAAPQDLVDTLAQNLIGSVKVATLNEIAYFYLPPRDSADPASHWDWRYNATANTCDLVDVTAFAPSQCNDRDHTIFFGCFDVKSCFTGMFLR
ncbi:hypothetical protein PAPYR_9215 [Paratrimastix pyriformis]|uniref:Uncharacterized protein n=1 Tax=Paratrimastix pyriformis TaxID=342808 RepID=A0ABQ8UAF7_9EUKA|nr:hypothetical protein PAPYR_9215 [Paratrimastix pyriformis]